MSFQRIPVFLLFALGIALAVAGCASDQGPPAPGATWIGTAWEIAQLYGIPVQDGIDSTLSFPEAGQVAGLAACNNYSGALTLQADGSASLGPLATTRKSCQPPIMERERLVLEALARTRRIERDGVDMLLYGESTDETVLVFRQMLPGQSAY